MEDEKKRKKIQRNGMKAERRKRKSFIEMKKQGIEEDMQKLGIQREEMEGRKVGGNESRKEGRKKGMGEGKK